jgi:hemolysin D
MADQDPKLERLAKALEDHSADGIEILSAEPSRLIHGTIAMIAALCLSGLAWSFIGHADVIVTAAGSLQPDGEVRRFYAPIEGELVDIYVAEGQPVTRGDVLARLNARGAIRIASNSLEANLKLSEAKREQERFASRKQLMERQAEALERKIEIARRQHEKRIVEGVVKMADAQKAKLQEARGNLEKASRGLAVARRALAKLERLFNMSGGGGVSRDQVETARSQKVIAEANYKVAEAKLGELDFLLSNEYAEAQAKLDGSDQELVELQIQRDAKHAEIEQEAFLVKTRLRQAELEAEVASRITFDNIDADNFLRILAPVDGTVTQVAFTQAGDKVQANTPLGGIAAGDSRPVLKVEIAESDRAFLQVGQSVKMKFNAFPYQRYGFIEGNLEYISPTTHVSEKLGTQVYKGRISLRRDYFDIENERLPLRFGMEASAEIVVRQRRIFDLVLDPFRKLKG